MLEWILEKLPVVIFVLVFLGQIVRGLMRARDAKTEPPPRNDELDHDHRTRRIQEEIRRKIRERRAAQNQETAAEPPPLATPRSEEPVRRDPTAIPLPEPLGGPLRRMFEELERKVQPVPPAPPPLVETRSAELERQQQLAEEMKALADARAVAARRAAQNAAAKAAEARSHAGLRTAARGRLLEDLHDRETVRRAFVLREVLGRPVGLR